MEDTLLSLAVLLIAAKLVEGLAVRFRQSPLGAYVLAGVVLGPVLGFVEPSAELSLFFSVGVIFLFFLIGVDELDISGFAATLRGRFSIAASIALLVPLAAGLATFFYVLELPPASAIGLSGLLALSSLGVVAKVLSDLGHLKEPLGLEIFTTVVIVELVGLLIVGFTLEGERGVGEYNLAGIGLLLAQIIGFALIAWVLASRLFTPMMVRLRRWLGGSQLTFGILVGGLFLMVVGAEFIGLHGSLGALLLGTALSGLPHRLRAEVMPGMRSIADGLFVPLFFSAAGLQLDLSFTSLSTIVIVCITLVAVVGKFAGALLAPLVARLDNPLAIGAGLMAKGVVEIALLVVMLESGTISQGVFSLVTIIMLGYIFVMPPIIGIAVNRAGPDKQRTRLPRSVLPSYARYTLDNIAVKDILVEGRQLPSGDLSISEFVERWVVPQRQDYVIVGEEDRLLGIFSVPRLRHIPKDRWPTLKVSSLTRSGCPQVYPDTPLDDVLERFAEHLLSALPVLDPKDNKLLGEVSNEDVMDLMVQPDQATGGH